MPAIKISIRPGLNYELIVRALAHFVLATSVLFIVFAALFPFDFDFPRTGLLHEIRTKFDSSPEPAVLRDRVQNFLFFVPFGVGLAASIRPKRGRAIVTRIVAALVLGLALSMTVEVMQVFLGHRDPTWLDVLMNTLGSAGGAVVVALGSSRDVEEAVARPLAQLKPYATLSATLMCGNSA